MVGKAWAGVLRVKDERGIPKRSDRQRLLPLALKGVRQCDDQRLFMKFLGQNLIVFDRRSSNGAVDLTANECFL